MKQLLKFSAIIFCLVFIGCDDDDEYIDSKEPGSITILDIEDNTVPVHTTETFQLSLAIQPEYAEVVEPVGYVYKSGDRDIFTVSDNGLITGVGVGEAVLTITTTNYPELRTMAIVKVTDRTYDVTAIEIDEIFENYSMSVGATVDLSKFVTVKPDNATNPVVAYSSSNADVASISESGLIEAKELGTTTITVRATDNSGVSAQCVIQVKEVNYVDLDRGLWTVSLSHDIPEDAAISNSAESLIDGDTKTCLSMVKPGKSYAGISVPASDEVFFIVDMKEEKEFDYVTITHRLSNTQAYLRPYEYAILGSNDGTNFTPIMTEVEGQPDVPSFRIDIPMVVKYRHVKVIYTLWDTKSGSTVQLSEFVLGKKEF